MSVFTLDGVEFDVWVTSLKRKFAVTDTDNSGRTLDGNMHRDIIGTYYNYTMEIELDPYKFNLSDYDQLYEMLSAPVEYHNLIAPYGQSTLEFKAYVTSGEDSLKTRNGKQIWNGLSINFIAMEPQRRP